MSTRLGGLMRGSIIYGIGQGLSRSMTLLLVPLLTAYLDPASYGVLAILTAFGLLLSTVFSVGLGAAMAPSYFEGGQKGATIWTAFAILCGSTSLMALIGWWYSPALSRVILGDEQYGPFLLMSVGATAFNILSLPFRQFLMFEERPTSFVGLSILTVTLSLGLTFWLVAGMGRGIGGVLEADLIAQGLTCAMFAVPVVISSSVDVRRQLAAELIRLGLPLIPAFGAVFVLQHASRYIIQWFDGRDQVGVYAVGVNIGAAVGLLVAGFQSAWMPYFMRFAGRRDEAKHAFARVATYYAFAVGGASLLLYLFARPAVVMLTGPEYRGAADVVGLAATAQFLSGSFLVLMPGLYFTREIKYVGVIQALAATASVALNFVLVPLFSYVGSAIAVTVSYVLLNAAQYWWNRRRGYLDVAYDWRRLRRFAVLYVTFASASFLPREWPLLVECSVSVVAAALLGLAIWRLLTLEERGSITRVFTGRPVVVADAPARVGRSL